jgi:hypothetical protein
VNLICCEKYPVAKVTVCFLTYLLIVSAQEATQNDGVNLYLQLTATSPTYVAVAFEVEANASKQGQVTKIVYTVTHYSQMKMPFQNEVWAPSRGNDQHKTYYSAG